MKNSWIKGKRVYLTGVALLGLVLLSMGVVWANQSPSQRPGGIAEAAGHGASLWAKEQKLDLFAKQAEAERPDRTDKTDTADTADATATIETNDKIVSTGRTAAPAEAEITVHDLPSPIAGQPLREAGNYYSTVLQAYLFHAGTDYAAAEGTIIRATHGGQVIFAGPDPLLGQKVTVDCGQGWLVTYGGLDNLQVHEGEQISGTAVLGQIGYYPASEGAAAAPQLHYEIWHGDEVIIPIRD